MQFKMKDVIIYFRNVMQIGQMTFMGLVFAIKDISWIELGAKVRNINAERKLFGESHELYPSRRKEIKRVHRTKSEVFH